MIIIAILSLFLSFIGSLYAVAADKAKEEAPVQS